MNILFFDTETTGIKSYRNPGFVPELVQIGAILYDVESQRVLAEINLIVANPSSTVPLEASQVHGISTEMMHKYGQQLSLVDSLFAKLVTDADLLVAHNINFDLDIVKDNLNYSHKIITDKLTAGGFGTFCTMASSSLILKLPLTPAQSRFFATKPASERPEFKDPKLMEAYTYFFNREFDGAHDAMADVRACKDVYFAIVEGVQSKLDI